MTNRSTNKSAPPTSSTSSRATPSVMAAFTLQSVEAADGIESRHLGILSRTVAVRDLPRRGGDLDTRVERSGRLDRNGFRGSFRISGVRHHHRRVRNHRHRHRHASLRNSRNCRRPVAPGRTCLRNVHHRHVELRSSRNCRRPVAPRWTCLRNLPHRSGNCRRNFGCRDY
jgi:hypothetical protein